MNGTDTNIPNSSSAGSEPNNNDGLVIKNGILEQCVTRNRSVAVPCGVHTIGKGAFKGCTSLEQILLPDTVTVISDDAFKGCRKLTEITLPDRLDTIGSYAFHRCHSLTAITIPASVKVLGNCVFLYCDSLETVNMPGVHSLGLQTFLNDVKLRRILISPELDIQHICDCFTGCSGLLDIAFSDGTSYHMANAVAAMAPGSDAPEAVRAIAADICRMMEIQDGVITRFLTNLKHVELAEGITAIGKSCFFDKKGIISVRLPASLTEIGSRAFRNCINLERVEFASDRVAIHKDAFKNCSTLHTIRLADGSEYELTGLSGQDETGAPSIVREIHAQVLGNFSISGTTLLRYRGSEERVVVPDGITVIGERAFAGNEAIDRVILPDSVEMIGEEAFADCLVLQTIQFPEGVRHIGKSAFENCVKLIRAILPDSLISICPSVFNRCRVLNEVRFSARLEEIGELAFYGCEKLKGIVLPETVTVLGDMAFYRCLSLRDIVLPPSLKVIGRNVFTHSGIRNAQVFCNPVSCGTDVFSQCGKMRRLTFEDGVRYVGDKFAFQCEKLAAVILPDSIESIGKHAFEGSRFLKELPANKTVRHILLDGSGFSGGVVLGDEVRAIAGGAFYGNTELTSITLPKTLSQIGPYAFCGCTGLTEVLLPPGVKSLEEGVFARCTALQTVSAAQPDGQLTSVSARAFFNCRELTEVPSLERCTVVGTSAFSGCEKLRRIEGVFLQIGDSAFSGTPFLEEQKRLGNGPLSGAAIVSGILIDGSGLSGDVTIPEGVAGIADYAFAGNDRLRSLHFPVSLKRIGSSSFAGCRNLKSVHVSAPLEEMGCSAFEKCISLSAFSCRIAEIGARAFAWCQSLESVTLEETVLLGDGAFCGCSVLKICRMENLRRMGREAFSCCKSLEAVHFPLAERIGTRAFERCDALKSMLLPALSALSDHSFEDCGHLEEILLRDGQNIDFPASYAFSGCTAIRRVILENTVYQLTGYETLFDRKLPEAVRRIYGSALSCFTIDEELALTEYQNCGRFVAIPEGVKTIGEEVFKDQTRLEAVTIPDSVEYIGPRAFDKTPWLEQQRAVSGTAPVTVKNIIIDAAACSGDVVISPFVKRISGWAFANCIDLTGIRFSSSRTAVEIHAFRNCIRLKRIVTADGREYCLEGLPSLDQELPSMVRQIFEDCYNCFKTDGSGLLLECTGNISRLTLPEGITEIGRGALKDSNLLTSITLPDSAAAVGACAFEQCKWLETVSGTSRLTRIGRMAFSGCVRLKRIEELPMLQSLGERTFENCTSLEEIILPEGIEEILPGTFYRCHELKRVVLPSTLKRIGKEAFAFCYNLTDITLPEGIEQIGERAFAWCRNHETEREMP